MAEGLDNDMNQQQQQESVPHGQEAFHTPSLLLENSSLDASSAPVTQQQAPLAQSGANQGQKKKSAFQITSVTETRAHSRGDSNGYDLEDLNESDVTEIEVETVDESLSRNGNGGSRFKVVRIQRNDPYVRGRWQCHDFADIEQVTSSAQSQGSGENREVHSTHSTAPSTSHSITNHISLESNTWTDSSLANHRNSVDVPSSSKQPILAQNLPGHVNFEASSTRKKDPDPAHLSAASKPDGSDSASFASSASSAGSERPDKLNEAVKKIPGVSLGHQGLPEEEEELPIVNTIATAMDQITQIKSALLTVVHEEVQTLKDTISKLKEENEELKVENEMLKQKVEHQET
ncbi:predicted protein [Nematostella vectensis]|uniref:Uncharacterized protein n=1 Tax=Nematostella vectensis TaxID=45351 RepID=A7SEF8_NEMVE|nr:predicted protein [Nematostella vectensis]|eukprot:XP_001630008.1 predicted protein [Nematostella vectensis]